MDLDLDLDFVVLGLVLEALACPATKRAISCRDSMVEKAQWRYCQEGAMGAESALRITLACGMKGWSVRCLDVVVSQSWMDLMAALKSALCFSLLGGLVEEGSMY